MPKQEIDYSHTIIYKIYCNDYNVKDIYVGRTTNFVQRKHSHKQNCANEKNQCTLYKVIRQNGGWNNWNMELINVFNCKDHYEARIKEAEYYNKLNATLNMIEPMQKLTDASSCSVNPLEKKITHKCINCNITCQTKQLLDIHNNTKKHLKMLNIKQEPECVDAASTQKVLNNFVCNSCDYFTCRKSQYDRHILTGKHLMSTICQHSSTKSSKINLEEYKCECGKIYKERTGLWKHKQRCNEKLENFTEKQKQQQPNELVMSLLNQNMELQKQIIELCKDKNTVINNTNCNNTTTNNNFSLSFFLNEQCKDALNIMDFINQLQLKLSDLDMVGKIGYTEGISQIFIRGLKELDVYKRPIHCSDLKRETLYVKDKDSWEKDDDDKAKIKLAIKQISAKNVKNISAWVDENPDSEDINAKKHMEYHNIIINAMGGSNAEEDEKNYNKIIKNVVKEVTIKKD